MTCFLHIDPRILRLLPGERAAGWLKGALARTLLLAYTLLILKPVMPVLIDVAAHTFWERVHIAVVHKVNGKEHVHYELCRIARESEKDKAGLKQKTAPEESYALPPILPRPKQVSFTAHAEKPVPYYILTQEDPGQPEESPPPKQA